MKLTLFTDLGLRTLMYLALAPQDRVVTISEITERFGVHRNHLIKVVQRLSALKWVEATRGRGGGLYLGHSVLTLGLGTVVCTLEERESLIDCHSPPCVLLGQCHLKHALDEALQAFYQHLNQWTVQDMVKGSTGTLLSRLHRI
jgi:Rrf2 family nitric oxide-sensitive transcriptional repressor